MLGTCWHDSLSFNTLTQKKTKLCIWGSWLHDERITFLKFKNYFFRIPTTILQIFCKITLNSCYSQKNNTFKKLLKYMHKLINYLKLELLVDFLSILNGHFSFSYFFKCLCWRDIPCIATNHIPFSFRRYFLV